MQRIYSIFSWKVCLKASLFMIPLVIILSFYGLYSNSFFLFKPANYIIPVLTLAHLAYLYVFWFKIKEEEFPDPRMRILEYIMYGVILFYAVKCGVILVTILERGQFVAHVIPQSFLPMGALILFLHLALIILSLILFHHRKTLIGAYNVDYLNEKIDEWPGL